MSPLAAASSTHGLLYSIKVLVHVLAWNDCALLRVAYPDFLQSVNTLYPRPDAKPEGSADRH
jgi:hypothetical protein